MMTIEEIRVLLEQSGADAWSIADEKRNGWEFYYIRHRLDQNRAVNTDHITVTVYRKSADGSMLGSASQELAPTASEEEAESVVRELLERASFVRNPVYELRKPVSGSLLKAAGEENGNDNLTGLDHVDSGTEQAADPAAIAQDFIRTMTSLPETKTEDVNSYEIFANVKERRLVTSTGIDITEHYPSSMLEVVTNAREDSDPRHEIELYRMYHSGTCDGDGLKGDIARTLVYGKDRLHTVPTPEIGTIPVVFSTADSVPIYDYYVSRMNAQQIYQKTSDWRIGESVVAGASAEQGEHGDHSEPSGDLVTVTAKRYLPNSSCNYRYDAEGAPVHDEVLIDHGIARHYWGNAQYSSYLGLSDTFQVTNYEISGGSRTEEEIRRGRFLEIVEFSDFQVDSVTGNIFGEIRLGYLHEPDAESAAGEKVTIVSGGSVSGSMRDYAGSMIFSRETVQYDNARVPAVTKLMDVTVTGAKA